MLRGQAMMTSSMTWSNLLLGYERELQDGSAWQLTFNVQNLFDDDPPVIPSSSTRFGAQIVDNTYDLFGRRYQMTFTYSL